MKENSRRSVFKEYGLEVAALGLGGIGLIFVVSGAKDYYFGKTLLKLPEVIQNPAAQAFAKNIVDRGFTELSVGIVALVASSKAIYERVNYNLSSEEPR